jgi:sugar phosphate permease
MLGFGWRWMFAILGIAGGAVAIAWAVLYRDPEMAGIPRAEQEWIRSEDVHEDAEAPLAALRTLLRHRTSWFMALGFFGVVYMTWLYATWLPDYLETSRHLTVEQAGIWAAVPMACGFFGALGGGGLSQALARRGVSPVASCTLPLIAAMVVTAICTLGTALVQSTEAAILLVSVALFCSNLASSCGWALATVATGAPTVATLEAIQNVGGSVGGTLAPALTGFVVQSTGSFTPALLIASGISLATGLVYWFGVRDPVAPGPVIVPGE